MVCLEAFASAGALIVSHATSTADNPAAVTPLFHWHFEIDYATPHH